MFQMHLSKSLLLLLSFILWSWYDFLFYRRGSWGLKRLWYFPKIIENSKCVLIDQDYIQRSSSKGRVLATTTLLLLLHRWITKMELILVQRIEQETLSASEYINTKSIIFFFFTHMCRQIFFFVYDLFF